MLRSGPPRDDHALPTDRAPGPGTSRPDHLGARFFLITMDAVVVTVALPLIHDDLGGGIVGLQWVVDDYTKALRPRTRG